MFEAIRAGAFGFLLKDTLPDELLAAVRLVAGGQALLALTRRLLEEFARRPPDGTVVAPDWLATLTAREIEVLVAVALVLLDATASSRSPRADPVAVMVREVGCRIGRSGATSKREQYLGARNAAAWVGPWTKSGRRMPTS
ncbi:MAG: hypothetical protein ACR2HQ_08210 [Ilumatobacteraceae bacterium]